MGRRSRQQGGARGAARRTMPPPPPRSAAGAARLPPKDVADTISRVELEGMFVEQRKFFEGQLSQVNREGRALKEKVSEQEEEISDLKNKVSKQDNRIKLLVEDTARLRLHNHDLEKEVEDLKSDNFGQKSSISALQRHLQTMVESHKQGQQQGNPVVQAAEDTANLIGLEL